MKNLEHTLEKVEPARKEKPLSDSSLYQGLRLTEDKAYNGPTGCKYWI